jgi:hypothetical protein
VNPRGGLDDKDPTETLTPTPRLSSPLLVAILTTLSRLLTSGYVGLIFMSVVHLEGSNYVINLLMEIVHFNPSADQCLKWSKTCAVDNICKSNTCLN